MRWLRGSKKLGAVVVAVTLLSGGAGAFAATQLSASPRQAYINDVASRLNVTPTALTSAMKQAMIDQINAAQKAGKLTAAQASVAKHRIEGDHAVGGPGGPWAASGAWRHGRGWLACGGGSTTTSTTTTPCMGRPRGGFGAHFGWTRCGQSTHTTTHTTTTSTSTTSTTAKTCSRAGGFGQHAGFGIGIGFGRGLVGLGGSAVTSYLGISAATLRSDLSAGKSLAQITSGISGKSVVGLESALTAAVKTQLEKAVSAGWMTPAQEAKALSAVASRLPELVDKSFKFPLAGLFHSFHKP